MGASTFMVKASGKTAREAFANVVQHAKSEYGSGGYTGTIAEKSNYVMITIQPGVDARDYAGKMIDDNDSRIDDKYGPAGCISMGDDKYLFFGWAAE